MRDSEFVSNFLRLVKQHREDQRYSIEQLADMAGIHRTSLGLLERNERSPTLHLAKQLTDALGVPLHRVVQDAERQVIEKVSDAVARESTVTRASIRGRVRNEEACLKLSGLTPKTIVKAIEICYETLDTIDFQLLENGTPPIARLVELANLSSMIGNILGAAIADNSDELYKRNRPHAYPDLIPQADNAVDLELKMSLEKNKPKGHLPKAGTYITFRYVLGNKDGSYARGKDSRGDTVWIWEVKMGYVSENDFAISNTAGDSGKTAVIKTTVFDAMPLLYLEPSHIPYAPRKSSVYPGYN